MPMFGLSCCMVLHLFNAVEVILPKPFCSDSSVVAFDMGVLLRPSRLDVDQPDPGALRPVLEPGTDVFGAVVHANGKRLAALRDDLVQRSHDTF